MKKIISVFMAVLMCMAVFTACSNTDPNVKKESTTSSDDGYVVDTSESSENENTSKSGDSVVDSTYYANRSYELRFLLAIDSFDSPSDISANAIVQYAFCRIYYDNLVDMPRKGVKMREATKKQIEEQIKKDFGHVDVDVTKADLYNEGKKKFEMWEPLYGTDIYYDAKSEEVSKNEYTVTTTFYEDEAKSEVKGTTVLTVEIGKDGKQYIKKLSSK